VSNKTAGSARSKSGAVEVDSVLERAREVMLRMPKVSTGAPLRRSASQRDAGTVPKLSDHNDDVFKVPNLPSSAHDREQDVLAVRKGKVKDVDIAKELEKANKGVRFILRFNDTRANVLTPYFAPGDQESCH